jgi:predicted DNA-binding protein (MmcQ/YjbR family)
MDIDFIRRLCLSLPRTKETLQWGETLVFKVAEKIFVTVDLNVGTGTRISVKCSPEKFAELLEREGTHPAPYVGRYQWIGLEELNTIPDRELEGLIRQSYAIVSAKAGRRTSAKRRKVRPRRAG